MRSRSLLLAIILTGVFQFSVVANAASLCQDIFSSAASASNLRASEGQSLARNMLLNRPDFYQSIVSFHHEGREYLEVKFVDNIEGVMGGGFVGGLFGRDVARFYHPKIASLLETYGIKVLSDTHVIVPTPKTAKSLHQKLVLAGGLHSFYEPVEVNGLITPQHYLTLLAQRKWPIDATGSIEYLHDLLVHFPGAASAPNAVVDLQTGIAKVALELLKDKELNKDHEVHTAIENVVTDAVGSIDGLNSSFYLAHGLKLHKQNMSNAIYGMLQQLGRHNKSAKQHSVSNLGVMKLNWRSRALLREQGLSKYFNMFWQIDRNVIEREVDAAFEQRSEEL